MKYTKSAILLFFSILMQMSFLRLIAGITFLPDIPFIILFVLSFRLPQSGLLVLATFTGVLIDLSSAVHFGTSIFAALGALAVCYFIRKNFFKGKNFGNIILTGALVFMCFYLLLFGSNGILDFLAGNDYAFNFFNKILAAEIISGILIASLLAYFFESKIDYVNIRDYKRYFKIPS